MIEVAAYWAAQLATDDATQSDRDACEAWCREHPMHRLAMDRMRGLDSRIDGADDMGREAIGNLFGRRSRAGRRLGQATLGLLLLAGGGWLAAQSLTVRSWFPDVETARGEQRQFALADGSGLTLDTDAAVDIDTGAGRRRITLFRGQLLARVAKDPARPFVVETRDGTATALGTAFVVRREAAATIVTVIESRVRACPADTANACLDLQPGDRARIRPGRVDRLARIDPDSAGIWAEGWLAANDEPVADVLAELNRYRRQPVRFDAAGLAGIRVSGSFPLADPDRALDGIAGSTGLYLSRDDDGAPRIARGK